MVPALIVAALVVGVAGRFIIEGCSRITYPPDHGQMGDPPEYIAAVRVAMTINSAVGYGVFGALLVGVLGALVGLASKPARLVQGAIVGALAGGILVAAAGSIGTFVEHTLKQTDMEGMIKTAMFYGGVFAAACIASAIAIAIGAKKPALGNHVASGILVAIFGIIGYIVVATVAFPVAHPETLQPFDESMKFLSVACISLAAAATCVLALREKKAK